MNEVMTVTKDMELKTKMERALQVDDDGMVSAKHMYDLLGLDPSHYARWCENNIIKNKMVTENVDFKPFAIGANAGGQATIDYRISLSFAEALCMMTRTEQAKEVRDYFLSLEVSIKNAAKTIAALQEQCKCLFERIEQTDSQVGCINNRLACLESGTSVSGGKLSKWVQDASADIMELAKYCDCTVKEMYSNVIDRMEQIYGINFQRYFDEYAASHPNEKPIWRIVVIEYYDLKDAFEDAYVKIGRDVGLYRRPDDYEW